MSSILFISLMNGAPWGGSEGLWHATATYAAEKGHNVGCAFYNWPNKNEKVNQLKDAGCELYFLPNKGRFKRNILEKVQYKISKYSLKSFLDKLPINNYDIIVLNLGGLEILSASVQPLLKKISNYFILFHSYNTEDTFSALQAKTLLQWINKANKVFFASDKIRVSFESKLNAKIVNSETFFNPVVINKPVEQAKEKNGAVVFSMLANLIVEWKAQDQLLKTLASPKWMQREWILNIYGSGKDRVLLEKMIFIKGLTKKVFLKGFTKDISAAISGSDVILQITRIDAMPISVLEAMALCKPVIVSRLGDMPRWVRKNVNGWVAEDTSINEIDRALEEAWSDRNKWLQMGKRSREIYENEYPEVVEQKLLEQIGITQFKTKSTALSYAI